MVFRDGLPAALIDFDLARPTTRLYDIANALWWWAPLRDPQDRAPAFAGADIPHRSAVFAGAYGITAQQRQDLVPLMIRMARRYHLSARAAADADPVFRRFWEEGAKDELPRAQAWLEQAAPAIAAALERARSPWEPARRLTGRAPMPRTARNGRTTSPWEPGLGMARMARGGGRTGRRPSCR